MFFILFAASILTDTAAFARFEGEPGAARPRCDSGAVIACQNDHRNAEGICRGYVSALDEKLAPVNRDLSSLIQRREDLASAQRNIEARIAFCRREMDFLGRLEKNSAKKSAALPGNLSLESVFQLDHFSTAWGPIFPAEWKRKLTSQEIFLTNSSQQIRGDQNENESKISALTAMKNELESQKNHWLLDIGVHVRMWQSTCQDQHCPAN